MTNKVSIATKPLVYSTFRFINNKVWYALAEYVDNSIQSYIDNKAILSKINPNGRLRVEISIQDDLIIVTDNAGGIAEGNFQRAFELANIPLDASGLNEFGMGMKVSSIWLSNVWKVETTVNSDDTFKVRLALRDAGLSYSVISTNTKERSVFNIYCPTKKESEKVKEILGNFDAKYFVTESKSL